MNASLTLAACYLCCYCNSPSPKSSVCSLQDLRKEGSLIRSPTWPKSFWGLIIDIATGYSPLRKHHRPLFWWQLCGKTYHLIIFRTSTIERTSTPLINPFTTQSQVLTTLKQKPFFFKHYGKRRKCWLPAFSPFPPNIFYQHQKEFLFWSDIYFLICKCLQFKS